jgi:ABC-type sugar transport system substrate-binding protein
MKKSLVIILVLAMMFGVLAACAAQPEAPAAPAPVEPAPAPAPEPAPPEMPEPVEPGVEEVAVVERENITMAFLFKDSTTPFWRYMWAGAVDAGERYGVTVVEFSPMQQQNHEEQVRHMEDVIMLDFDVIMLAAIDTTAIIPSIYQVVDAGIPVITANTRVDGGPVETFIGLNNYEGALILSQNMMEMLGGEGTVVIVDGNPASTVACRAA